MIAVISAAQQWDRNTQGDTEAGLQLADVAAVQTLDPGNTPPVFSYPRQGFQGLRTPVSLRRIVSAMMPGIPWGPPKVIASRDESLRGGRPARQSIQPAASYNPVMSVEQTAPYWEYLN